MIVVDASVLSNMLAFSNELGQRARRALARDIEWVAPEHWRAEVFSAIRGLTLGKKIDEKRGKRAIDRIAQLGIETVSLDDLIPRMWQLRGNISGYDAAYVALAEARSLTLVTADARLAQAAVGVCRTELAANR